MALTYHKKDDEREEKNTADPWRVFGMGYRREKAPNVPVAATLTGGFKDETIAAYLDGSASPATIRDVQRQAAANPSLAAFLRLAQDIDEDVIGQMRDGQLAELPLTAVAASERTGCNACGLRCEEYVLQSRGVHYDDVELVRQSQQHGWLRPDGMRIGDVGNALSLCGLHVEKHFNCTLELAAEWLRQGRSLILVVDGGELVGDPVQERLEDLYIGGIPDHAVVLRAVDFEAGTVDIFDPQGKPEGDTWPLAQFDDAWADSSRYAVVVSHPGAENAWQEEA